MSNLLTQDLEHILSHTQDLWSELQGGRIFITGGTGFFGCWLLESFIWANDQLGLNARATVLTRSPAAFQRKAPHLANHPTVELLQGDVCTFHFPQQHYSHIIHAATESSARLNSKDPLGMIDTIVTGTGRTLEFARHCGAAKFLLTSSGAVYGPQPSGISHIPEEYQGAPDPTDPHSAYGEGKRMAELLCSIYSQQYGFETKIARCFAFVGPYLPLDIHFAIGNFIRDGLNGGPIQVKGDGTPYRSYLYAADLAIWLWTVLFKGVSKRPYNVGSEEPFTIEQLARQIASISNTRACQVIIHQKTDPLLSGQRYIPQTKRAHEELNLNQFVNFQECLLRTYSWVKNSRNAELTQNYDNKLIQ